MRQPSSPRSWMLRLRAARTTVDGRAEAVHVTPPCWVFNSGPGTRALGWSDSFRIPSDAMQTIDTGRAARSDAVNDSGRSIHDPSIRPQSPDLARADRNDA